jgi:hypothetical protein
MEGKPAATARTTDDPAGLVDLKRNSPTIGVRALETDAKHRDHRDQSAEKPDWNSHSLTSLVYVAAALMWAILVRPDAAM